MRSNVRRAAVVSALIAVAGTQFCVRAGAQNVETGKQLFEKCLACHAVGSGAQHKNGPVLNGAFGRRAGAAEGFVYSAGMKDAGARGLTWSEETLEQYLADPIGLVPRSKMAWAVKDAGQRRDIIAYIKTLK